MTGVLGAVGVVWGIVGGSQMILLDGVYAIIGIVVSFLLLGASALAAVALRGLGMIVGFSILGLLTGSRWDGVARYVDPVMVLVTCVLFLPAPYRMVRLTVGEMMEATPDSSVVPVIETIEAVIDHHQLDDPVIRLSKLGPRLYVEVDLAVRPRRDHRAAARGAPRPRTPTRCGSLRRLAHPGDAAARIRLKGWRLPIIPDQGDSDRQLSIPSPATPQEAGDGFVRRGDRYPRDRVDAGRVDLRWSLT